MRIVIVATVVAAAGLIAAGVLGVATAETPTAPPPRTVSVQGVAIEPIDQSASAATATAVYRQGMADAVSDGQTKAQFLASKVGTTLGPVQSVIEGGGYISCAGEEEYLGEQPDFGSPEVSISANGINTRAVATPRSAPTVRKPAVRHGKHGKAPAAKKASTAGCMLSTQVSLVYILS
jgi:hypothetical protein